MTSIGRGAFEGCTGLTSIDIPNSVTSIGDGAFKGCTGLASIDIPNSVTSIGNSAFYGCTGLTSIDIPNSVTKIDAFAFHGAGLEKIKIPSSVKYIGKHAFCNNPTAEFKVEADNTNFMSVDGVLFGNMNGDKWILFSKTDGETWNTSKHIILLKYAPKKSLSKYEIDAETKELGCCAFKGANNLEEIVFHDGISDFGDEQTFAQCTSLKKCHIPPKVKRLPPLCFGGCYTLENIYVPDREELHIDKESFKKCISLRELHFLIKRPEIINVAIDAFDDDIFDKCTLFIPSGTRWAYRHHSIFCKFNNIEIE